MGVFTCRQLLAMAALTVVQAIFATYHIWGKEELGKGVDPVAFALLRELCSSIVFVAAAAVLVKREQWPAYSQVWRCLVCGVSMFGTVFFLILGLQFTSPEVVAMLQPMQPVLAAALATIAGQEKMSCLKALGILICCAGSAVLTLANGGRWSLDLGSVIILLQCICGANYVVQQRPLLQAGIPPLVVACCSYVIATVFTVLVGSIYLPFKPEAVTSHALSVYCKWSFLFFMLFVVLFATVHNYVAISFATKELGPTMVTIFLLLQGVFSSCFEWILYRATISRMELDGAGILAVGLACVVYAARRQGTGSEPSDDPPETTSLDPEACEKSSVHSG